MKGEWQSRETTGREVIKERGVGNIHILNREDKTKELLMMPQKKYQTQRTAIQEKE